MFIKTRSTAPAGSLIRCADLNGENSTGPLPFNVVIAGFPLVMIADYQNGAPSQKFYGIDGSGNIVLYDTANSGAGIQSWLTAATSGYTPVAGCISLDNTTLYLATAQNKLITVNTTSKAIAVFAGSGTAATTDGTGAAAAFWAPVSVAIDPLGKFLLVLEKNDGTHETPIRTVTVPGAVVTSGAFTMNQNVPHPGSTGIDKRGNLWFANVDTAYFTSPNGEPTLVTAITGIYMAWVVPDDDEPGPTNIYFAGQAQGTILKADTATATHAPVASSNINTPQFGTACWRNPGLYCVDAAGQLGYFTEYWA